MSFPRYPGYKSSGVEWLGDVPAHWVVTRLKYAMRLLTDRAERRSNPVALENIEGWTGRLIVTDTEFGGDGTSFARGDILFGKLRPYLAKVFLATGDGEAVGDFHVIRPGKAAHGRFAQYQMLTRAFIDIVDGSTFGSKMPRASWEAFGGMAFVMPPLREQESIAAFLDAETAKIDALVAEQQRLLELLKEKRHAVISRVVTRGLDPSPAMKPSGIDWLGEVPANWLVTRMANLFREVVEPGSDELPILTVSIHHGVSDDEVDEEDMERKVTRSDDRSKYKRVAPGDLAYNMMRAWQGGFGAVAVPGMISPAYVVARPKRPVETDFFEKLLRTPKAIEQMRRHSRGITDFRLRLYWDEFKNIRVAVPPIEEQRGILEEISRMEQRFDALANEAQKAIGLLQERRAALISAAVTGQIDVRDPSARTAA